MPYISRTSRRNIALFSCALLAVALTNWLLREFFDVLVFSCCYLLLLSAWSLTAWRRILQKRVRRYFVAGALLLALLFVLRELRWHTPPGYETLDRCLWYAFYLPLTAVPLCSFSAALYVGKEDDAPVPLWLHGIFTVWTACMLLILLNDFHGLMFGFAPRAGDHLYGPLYAFTFLWMIAFTLASIVILLRKCRISQCRTLWFVPLLAAAAPFALLLWYLALGGNSPVLFGQKLFHFQEAYALLFVLLWESCIQIGLIPTNSDYAEIFAKSPLGAFITDRSGALLERSEGAEIPPRETLSKLHGRPLALGGDQLLESRPIRYGRVWWTTDVSAIHAANREMSKAIEYLEGEQSLLEEEYRIRAERAEYEAKNRIYDRLAPVTQPFTARIHALLSEETGADDLRTRLAMVQLLGVYVKRRVNLALLAEGRETLPLRELELSLKEFARYFTLRGVPAQVTAETPESEVPVRHLTLMLDCFEAAAEAALPSLSAALVVLRADAMSITLGTPASPLDPAWRAQQLASAGAVLSGQSDEGSVYVRLRFMKDGRP